MGSFGAAESPAGKAVLVVEDCPEWRALVTRALQRRGFDVRCADCVSAAVDLLHSAWRPDFVVSDFCLPGGNGDVLLAAVVRLRPDIVEQGRFVFVTGEQCLPVGVTDLAAVRVLSKPCRLSRLTALLEHPVA